ncbi:hypothetical protein [uncultured Corynebacterium sp.]|uniref:hypothetical protein n=1 Tax=uncultured Corynebacterium sp. TaxID=159447 RepID=UPI0025F45D76|nr:hypothetical protein [uncultured Corynebacterium sp.]
MSEKLTVAELLARNAREGGRTASGRPRRRRNLDEGGVSVSELTGSIPVVRIDDEDAPADGRGGDAVVAGGDGGAPVRTHGGHEADPADAVDPGEKADAADSGDDRGAGDAGSVADTGVPSGFDEQSTVVQTVVPDSLLSGAGSVSGPGAVGTGADGDDVPAAATGDDVPTAGGDDDVPTAGGDDDVPAVGGGDDTSVTTVMENLVVTDLAEDGRGVRDIRDDLDDREVREDIEDLRVLDEVDDPADHDDPADRDDLTDRDGPGAGAPVVEQPRDLGNDEVLEYEDDTISWPALIGQSALAVIVGVLIFFGFTLLWDNLASGMVLVMALVVTFVCVGVVHSLLRHRDTLILVLTFVVGIALTVGPRLIMSI